MSPDYFFYRPQSHFFLYRNGMNDKIRLFPLPGMDKSSMHIQHGGMLAGNGVNDFRLARPSAHTFFDYIPDAPQISRIKAFKNKGYFQEHPDYFSMDEDGKRVVRQLCFSNPGLRMEFRKNIYEHIRSSLDRNVFSVTAADSPGLICHCPECRNAVQKYRTNGAPVFLFVKELAEAVEKDFAGIKIWTYAYRKEQTEVPPVGLDFPNNVIVDFCPIDDDMTKNWKAETNAETYRNLKEWKKHCRNVFLGYYVNPYTFGTWLAPPLGNVYRCAEDILLARDAGVTGCAYYHPVGVASMTGFTELQSYLMARLMRNPELNIGFLIDDFMAFEYGAAAPLMRKYLNELEKVASETKVFAKWNAVPGLWGAFLKTPDVVRWQGYFDRMEELTAEQPEINFSVRRVRVPLDVMTLRFFRRIKREMPDYGMDVKELGDRIRMVFHQATDAFYPESDPQVKAHKEKHNKSLDNLVSNLTIQEGIEPKPIPQEVFGNYDPALIFEFFPEPMGESVTVKDDRAAWSQAVFYDGLNQGFPIQCLETDRSKRLWNIFSEIRVPQEGTEGKYCFYNIGSVSITSNYEIRIHFEGYRYLFQISPSEVWMPGTDDTVTIYLSLKMTGPKYYPDSKERNSLACDRFVLVRKSF